MKSLKLLGAFLFTIVVISFFSCQIGLGEQVDTATPSAEITYPDPESIIRGAFVIKGACSDDMGVSKVSVSIGKTNSTGGTTKIGSSQEASILDNGAGSTEGAWSIFIDPTSFSDTTLLDGSYIATVVASDKSGHSSSTLSLAFAIDNTAPVFIISSPSSKKISNPTPYGRKLKVAGSIADDHTIKQMNISVYNSSTKSQIGKTIQFTNVEPSSVASGKVIAQYVEKAAAYKNGTSEANPGDEILALYDNYLAIYSNGEKIDTSDRASLATKSFYIVIELVDNAAQYTGSSTDSTDGNKTVYYYNNDDINSTLLSSSGYGLNADSIKKILNGTYTGTLALRAAAPQGTTDAIADIKKILSDSQIDTTKINDSTSAFSLNPDAAPRYDILSCSYTTGQDGSTTISNRLKSIGSDINYTAAPGRDAVNLKPWTFVVNLYKIENKTIPTNPTFTIPSGYSEANGSVDSYTGTFKIPESYVDSDGNTVKISSGDKFVVEITGTDQEDEDLYSESTYGFQVASSGNPPTVSFGATSGTTNVVTNSYVSSPSTDSSDQSRLLFNGTATTDSSAISKVNFAVSIANDDNNSNAFSAEASTDITPSYVSESGAGVKTYSWSCDIASLLSTLTVAQISTLSNGTFLYTITATAYDNTDLKTSITRQIYVDTVNPTLTFDSITPLVDSKYLNGVISISGVLEETNPSSVYYTVKSGSEANAVTVYQYDADTSSYTEKFSLGKLWTKSGSFDTTASWFKADTSAASGYSAFTCVDNAELTVTVTAVDKAGRTCSVDKTYTLLQSTDSPKFETKNFTDSILIDGITSQVNLFDTSTAGSVITAQISDDDSISSVSYNIYTYATGTNSTVGTNYTSLVPANSKSITGINKTPYTLSIQLPSTEGKYKVEIKADDTKKETNCSSITLATTFVAVDTGVPSISLDKSSGAFVQENPTIKITTSDSSGIAKVERYALVYSSGTQTFSVGSLESVIDSTGTSVKGSVNKNDKFNISSGSIGNSTSPLELSNIITTQDTGYKRYISYDKYGRTNSIDFGWKIDKKEPTFKVSTIGGSTYEKSDDSRVFNMGSAYQITGTINDVETTTGAADASQIEGMYYKVSSSTVDFTEAKTETNGWYAATLSRSTAGSASLDEASWTVYIDSTNLKLVENTAYTVYLAAMDKAGYVSLTASNPSSEIKILPDKTPPAIVVKINDAQTNSGLSASYKSGEIRVTGTLEERNYSTFSVTTTQNGVAKSECSLTSASGNSPSYTFTVPTITTSGDWAFTITATDKAGLSSTWTGSAKIDNDAPVFTPTNLSEGKIILSTTSGYDSEKYTVSGTLSDSGIGLTGDSLYYSTALACPTISDATWTIVKDTEYTSGNSAFSVAVPVTESVTRISFMTKDSLENAKTYSYPVTVDLAVPTVSDYTATIGGDSLSTAYVTASEKGKSLVVTTTVTDSLNIGKKTNVKASATLKGAGVETGNKNLIISTSLENSKTVKVTFTIKIPNDENAIDDGEWVFSVNGSDAVGQSASTKTKSVTIDTVLPTVSFINSDLANDKLITETSSYYKKENSAYSYTVNGTWSDSTSGTDKLYYSTDSTVIGTGTWIKLDSVIQSTVQTNWSNKFTVTEGPNNKFSFYATDKAGNPSAVSSFTGITFDFAVPTVTLTNGTTETTTKDAFSLTGTIKDSLSLPTTDVTLHGLTITAKKDGSDYTGTFTPSLTQVTENKEYSFSIPLAEGKWVVTLTAKDNAGRSSTSVTTSTIIYDKTAPSFVSTGETLFTVGGKTYSTSSWYNDTSLSFVGYYKEDKNGSGIKSIYYWVNPNGTDIDVGNTEKSSGSITPNSSYGDACKFIATISNFTGNTDANTIYFAAVDEADNKENAVGPYTIKIDSEQPLITPEKSETILSNASSEVTATGTVSDSASGVDTADSKITITKGSFVYTDTTTKAYKVTLDTSDLAGLSNGVNVINATVYDNAGNSYTGTVCTLQIDKTPPTATISYPTESSIVNKKITVTGTASDTQSFGYATLSYSIDSGSTWTQYKYDATDTDNATTKIDSKDHLIISDNSWSYIIDTTKLYNGIETKALQLKIDCYDSATNKFSLTRIVTIDQKKDRPVINVTNVNADGGIMKYGTDAQLEGNLTDDDSLSSACVKEFIVSGTKVTDGTGATGKTTFNSSTGDWTYKPEDPADGVKTVYFYIKDNNDGIFYTGCDTLGDPCIKFKGENETTNTAAVTYKSDSKSPTITSVKCKYGSAETLSTSKEGMVALALNLGGTYNRYAQIVTAATDSSNIAGMTMIIKDSSSTILASLATDATAYDIEGGTNYNLSGSIDASGVWTSDVIDLSTYYASKSGVVTIETTVYDNSGLYSNATSSFNVDNVLPEVNITSPTTDTTITSTTKLLGTASDGASGIEKIEYAIPLNGETYSATAGTWTSNDNNSTSTISHEYSKEDAINSDGTSIMYYAKLCSYVVTEDADVTKVYSVDKGSTYYKEAALTNKYSGTGTIGTDATSVYVRTKIDTDVYNIPVYFRVTDNVGNVYFKSDYYMVVDIDAGRPTAKILYPENKATAGEYNSVGGTFTIYGTATDDVKVSYVKVQLDADGDGDFDSEDYAALNSTYEKNTNRLFIDTDKYSIVSEGGFLVYKGFWNKQLETRS